MKLKRNVSQVTESDELLKLKKKLHVTGSEDLLEMKEINISIALAHTLINSLCILMPVLTAAFNHLAYCWLVIDHTMREIRWYSTYGCNATYNHVAPRQANQLGFHNIVSLRCISKDHA